MKTLTVFTPTYNRAYCLNQIYQSLVRQTSKDFLWLLIDDGSVDNTKELVAIWITEAKITIQYHYQENLGMHGGHNAAYRLITSELNVCIDSDDFMPDNAVEKILQQYPLIKDDASYAGLVGLDADKNGKIIGTQFPDHLKKPTLYDLYSEHKIKGDKKLVYKTSVVQQYPPYPIFKGERFVPLGDLYLKIDQTYFLYPVNEVFCIVEYLADGSSLNMLQQYRRHPKGFAFSRIAEMQYSKSFLIRFKKAIHYVSSNLFTPNKNFIADSPKKLLTVLALPFGVLLHLYIRFNTKKNA
jgi:glycosyltransferase involved in cell wall biosynthesis